MNEEEGVKHLKDWLFHRLKPNIHNALHYIYDKPKSQYSQLVMAARKAKTETPVSNVPEVRAVALVTVVGTDLQPKVASSNPPYEAIVQQITYLMSTITNQNPNKNHEHNGSKQSNGKSKFSNTKFQRPKKDRKDMKCWGCGGTGHGWRECSTPKQGNNLPFRPANQNLNGQWAEETQASNPLPAMTREESTLMDN